MTLRTRLAIEVLVLAVLTAVFLLVFPQRTMWVDAGLALLALAMIGGNAGFTRREVWARFPPEDAADAGRQAYTVTLSATAVVVLANLGLGMVIAVSQGGWEAAFERLSNWRIVVTAGVYFLWALLQQTLFQFYLLGRLRVLVGSASAWPAIALTGLGYALVHLPDPWITAVTVVMGVFWTWVYHRFRRLVPLALSHAALGSTFYYWVYGRDLAAAWFGF